MDNDKNQILPDLVFEVSWEVCNKIGGIYTVVSTKAPLMAQTFGDNFMMIGPDIYKGPEGNVEFLEDTELLRPWREQSQNEGLKFRIGRWDIPSKPIAILIDFSPFFGQKDAIFAKFWESNKLDSISGGWNYIEPAIFGYAAGKLIESYKAHFVSPDQHVLAHFHEWLTGSGVLYLENTVPDVATVFTTHATATGRSISGKGLPFYSKFESYSGDQKAREHGLTAVHSLEKTAAITADAFTTVSDNTAKECEQLLGKAVDRVATNGFDDSFVPENTDFDKKRPAARSKLLQTASAVMGYTAKEDSILIATSGRYEYRNKGLDLFLEALGKLNQNKELPNEIIAFVMVPAAHTAPKPEVVEGLRSGNLEKGEEPAVLTHYLQDPAHDEIWQRIKENGLDNDPSHQVKTVYAPVYLDGRDGVFDSPYYDLLIGLDLTVFPSYYEPFGYTPLESLAFHIPTVTTTLTGFGIQVKSAMEDFREGMLVVERSDFNEGTVIDQITNYILEFGRKNKKEVQNARKKAFEISRSFLWKNLISNYYDVYSTALERYSTRARNIRHIITDTPPPTLSLAESNEPIWKSAMVEVKVPDALKDLERLAKNLWWTWHPKAIALFSSIDETLWEAAGHNPIALFASLSYGRFLELEKDEKFMGDLKSVIDDFNAYMAQKGRASEPKIAYLCMEYGLHESLPIYSGGLGILAGDYLKEASDKNTGLTAFGLLYRYGYFTQRFNMHGDQVAHYEKQQFTRLPMTPVQDAHGNRLLLQMPLRGPMIHIQVWKVAVGRINLYLFDTDIPENSDDNKQITHHLYGGDWENRFRQELLLAVSAVQLIEALQLKFDLYHYNEGHTAFTALVRGLRMVAKENLSFEEAGHLVRASTLFTTHTPVPAGHDAFSEDLLRSYQSHYADRFNISWERLLALGRINASDKLEKFSMSYLAARMSGEINAVSKIHERVTREMFKPLWKGIPKEELEIGHVTNGVHSASWTAPEWQDLFTETFGAEFWQDQSNGNHWQKVGEVPAEKIIEIKKILKKRLIKGLEHGLKRRSAPKLFSVSLHGLDENRLIIGFARRFATYKRADLLFRNTERLARLVNDPERPITFLFAGKAHPADKAGQDIIKHIIELSRTPEFLGKIIFLENYDMALARLMVQGVDVWLNTPERGREASGTSGMKAVLNGTLNFSALDGWWAEGYQENAGWALPLERTFENQNDQDDLDAATVYDILEHEIIPQYYETDKNGIQQNWVGMIKNAFANIAPRFTMTRMMDEYDQKFYRPMYGHLKKLTADDYALTGKMVEWTKEVNAKWPQISVADVQVSAGVRPLQLGEKFQASVTLNLNGLSPDDIGVELVFARQNGGGDYTIYEVEELPLAHQKSDRATYLGEATASFSGAFKYDIRFFPKNEMLRHRRDFPLVKWI